MVVVVVARACGCECGLQGHAWRCGSPFSKCTKENMTYQGFNSVHDCDSDFFSYGFGPWLTADVCDWYGVACSPGPAFSIVVSLCLPRNDLNGTLVDMSLPNLRFLNLAGSPYLRGSIPALSTSKMFYPNLIAMYAFFCFMSQIHSLLVQFSGGHWSGWHVYT